MDEYICREQENETTDDYTCDNCGGAGELYYPNVSMNGDYFETVVECKKCDGTGISKAKIMSIITDESTIDSRGSSNSGSPGS